MFDRQVLKVLRRGGCDALRCDNDATTAMDIKNIDSNASEREYWCDSHSRERRQQISAHSRLLIISEYTLVEDCEHGSEKTD